MFSWLIYLPQNILLRLIMYMDNPGSNLKREVRCVYKCMSLRRSVCTTRESHLGVWMVYTVKLIVLAGILFRSGAELHYFQRSEETIMPQQSQSSVKIFLSCRKRSLSTRRHTSYKTQNFPNHSVCETQGETLSGIFFIS